MLRHAQDDEQRRTHTPEIKEEEVLHPDATTRIKRLADLAQAFGRNLLKGVAGFLNVAIKIFDIVDDLFGVIARSVKTLEPLLPMIVGVFSFIGHSFVAVTSALKVRKAYSNEDTLNRKSTIASNSTIATLGLGGVGVAIAYFCAKYVIVAGAVYMPVILPAIMSAVILVQFIQLKKNQHELERRIDKIDQNIREVDTELNKNSEAIKTLTADLKKIRGRSAKTDITLALDLENNKKIIGLIADLENQRETLTKQKDELLEKHREYSKAKEKVDRKIAYKKWEIFASTMVLVGTILGTAAIIGGTAAATLGIAPTILAIGGVILGIAVKLREIDEKNNYKYSTGFINFFRGTPKPVPEPDPQPKPTSEHTPLLGDRFSTYEMLKANFLPSNPVSISKPSPTLSTNENDLYGRNPEDRFPQAHSPSSRSYGTLFDHDAFQLPTSTTTVQPEPTSQLGI